MTLERDYHGDHLPTVTASPVFKKWSTVIEASSPQPPLRSPHAITDCYHGQPTDAPATEVNKHIFSAWRNSSSLRHCQNAQVATYPT
ncbi:hypothetical protein FHS27_003805 [Rhodopirellula rubra]|uniref:Uncharacterized protein n=1 Tax=Aporhodopirellula rubra TaxID=980271 RepID=A0A7W5E0K7_9BACT|nr:hypothetical protein [Aporhodopirellula rubra]MBB3207978.1 hypothetical protein [Aporhodopirellula rubra]